MTKKAKILITGDTHLGGGRVKELAEKGESENLFGDFLPLIRKTDIAITNLESPLIDEGTPIPKTGPNLKSPVESIRVLKNAGFNLVTLANNHIMDYGHDGLFSTVEACSNAGIETVGVGESYDGAVEPFICEINEIHISVINIAENEFGTTNNGTPGAHPMDPVQNFYTIKQAKEKSDYVIVIIHGGHEHYELPSPRMKKTYRFLADSGADLVVGHHTHCISGYEEYNGIPIFYSLGNFLFDKTQRNEGSVSPWNIGFILEVKIDEGGLQYMIHPYVQNGAQPGLRFLNEEEKSEFNNKLTRLNAIIQNDTELEEKFVEYCNKSANLYNSYIEPHSITFIHALRNRNLLPALLSERKKRLLLNLTRCEAHRDVLIKTLSS